MTSRMTSDVLSYFQNITGSILFGASAVPKFAGKVDIGNNIQVTGSLSVIDEAAVGGGTMGVPVLIMSGAVAVSSSAGGNHLSSSIGLQMTIGCTHSLELGGPAAATLQAMYPNALTGSIYMVGSGSESWLAFKDISGIWRTITASLAT